jgi:outer membrane protein
LTSQLRFGVLTAVVLSCWSAAAGQQAPSSQPATKTSLTIAGAIEMAAAKYPSIRAAEQQREAAREEIGVARAAYFPRADLLWQGNRATTNKPNISPLGQATVPIPDAPARETTGQSDWNTATGVLFSWQPFDFGARHAQVGVAQFGLQLASRAADLTRLEVESAAAGAFLDVAAARQLVRVQQANVKRMEDLSRSIRVLVDNTLRPGADASQADAQLAMARTQLIQAQTQEQVRMEALANLLQISSDELQVDDTAILAQAPPEFSDTTSVESHPAVEQETAVRDQAKEQLHLLNRSWAPSFSLYGSVSGLGAGLSSTSPPVFQGGTTGLTPQTYNWLAAVQVTFPALQILTLRPQQRAQQAEVNSAEATRQRLIGDVSAQVKEARALLAGAKAVAQNTPVELDAARQSETQQRARYQAGLATVIEVSAAEAALAQAEGDDAVVRLSVWRGLAGVAEAEGDLAPFLKLLQTTP